VLRAHPNFGAGLRVLSPAMRSSGEVEAQEFMEHLLQLAPALRLSSLGENIPPLRRPEERARYTEVLRKAGLPEI
jgi:hypothetical protein